MMPRTPQKRRATPRDTPHCVFESVSGLAAAGPSNRPTDAPPSTIHLSSISVRKPADSEASR